MKRKVLPCFMALSMTLTAAPNVVMAEDGSMNEAGTVVETTTETGTTTGTEPAEEWTIVNKKDTIFKYIFWERLDSLPIPESCFHFVWCQIA